MLTMKTNAKERIGDPEINKLQHLAVCLKVNGELCGIVLSGPLMVPLLKWAETFENKVGYVGGDTFQIAVKRAGMMERNEIAAWGPLA